MRFEACWQSKTRKRVLVATASGTLLLLLGIALLVLAGAKDIPFDGVLHALFDYQEALHDQLIRDVRLSHASSALLTEGLLVADGVMIQGILRNPIAESSILDIMQGSVTSVAAAPMLPLLTAAGNLWTALTSAGSNGLLVFPFAVKYIGYPDISRIPLADSTLSILFLSVASLSAFIQDRSQELALWITGGFRQADWGIVVGLGVVMLVCMGSFLLLSGKVNLLSLSDKATISLGIDAVGSKRKVVLVVIPLCAMCVVVAGNVGSVGLSIPHILRSMLSRGIRRTSPLSFLFGGVLMVFSDIATKTLSTPYELPVGLFTALPGIPVFLLLVRKECG